MTEIFVIDANDEGTEQLRLATENNEYKVNLVATQYKLFDRLSTKEHMVVLLPISEAYDLYSLCTEITLNYPLTTVILVFQTEEQLDMKEALRSGAKDVIFLSSPPEKIIEDIATAVSNSQKKLTNQPFFKAEKNAKVIAVASTKGGIGKTTVAVNLAASFGKKVEKVAVVDLDMQFGDIAMVLDLKPKKTIYDWVKEGQDETQIESFMTDYKNGISILAAPQRPEFAEVITGEDVKKTINILKQQFDVVIIDASSHMDENIIVALESSDEILVMTYLDLPTLKNSKMLIDTLSSLQLGDRIKVVLNRQMKVKGLALNTVEKVVGQHIFATLPAMEKAMVTAVNEGTPLVYSNSRSKLAKKFFRIAENLLQPNSAQAVSNKKEKRMVHAGGHA